MRSGRSFLILLIVALGLGAYVYFVESKRDPSSATPSTREKVFTIEAGKIEAFEIQNADRAVTKVARTGTEWRITAPENAEADAVEISTVVSSIESLERTRVVEENPASAAPFGLDPARIILTFRLAGETTTRRLLVGQKTPTGGDLYAKIDGDPKVFLIGGYLEDSFNKKPFDLREKSLLKFSRDGIDSLTLTEGTKRLAFVKNGSDWRIAAPIEARADFSAIDGLVGRIFQARMTGLESAASDDLKKYGLDKPQVVVALGAGSSRAELAVGGKKDDASFYARDLSRALIFTIEKSLLDELKKKPEDLRLKDLFEFRSFSAVGLDVAYGGQTLTFGKKKGEGEGAAEVWAQTAPAAKAVDQTKFTDFMMAVSNLRAESFAEKALTAGETVTVTARSGDAAAPKVEQITLRKAGTVVHAIRAGEPGAAVVNTADFDRALGLLKELAGTK